MVTISIKKDMQKLMKEMGSFKAKQLPYAYQKTLNSVALEAKPIVINEFERELTIRSKSLLKKAIQINFTNKGDFPHMESEIGIMVDFDFLDHHVTGEKRESLSRHGKAIPQAIKRSSNGKIPASKRPSALLERKGIFKLETRRNGTVLAKREGKSKYPIKILYGFKKTVTIIGNVHFESSINDLVDRRFDIIFGHELGKAIKNAK